MCRMSGSRSVPAGCAGSGRCSSRDPSLLSGGLDMLGHLLGAPGSSPMPALGGGARFGPDRTEAVALVPERAAGAPDVVPDAAYGRRAGRPKAANSRVSTKL